jgi:hypothetical protein
VKNEQELKVLPNSTGKVNIFHYPLSTFHYRLPPPPWFIHFNIGNFAKISAKTPTKHVTTFFIVILLILQGFIEVVAIRLPQNKRQKKANRNRLSSTV